MKLAFSYLECWKSRGRFEERIKQVILHNVLVKEVTKGLAESLKTNRKWLVYQYWWVLWRVNWMTPIRPHAPKPFTVQMWSLFLYPHHALWLHAWHTSWNIEQFNFDWKLRGNRWKSPSGLKYISFSRIFFRLEYNEILDKYFPLLWWRRKKTFLIIICRARYSGEA